MKLSIVACLLAIAACTYAEKCTVNSECGSTSCSTGYHVICEHPAGGVTTLGGLCTCAMDNYWDRYITFPSEKTRPESWPGKSVACTTRADCVADNVMLKCIDDRHRHCYDGKCICTRW